MKEFTRHAFDPVAGRRGLDALRDLLAAKAELEEAADIKPFFEAHPQVALLLGAFGWNPVRCDLLAFQYQLFGDYSCDLVVGDGVHKVYGFIEWESAADDSLFRQQGRKATPEWSSRLERGFSQIVDWFHKLDDMERTDEFEARFGARHVDYFGMLVIGRDRLLSHPRERRRWEWRSRKVLVNGSAVRCLTYDEVYRLLEVRLADRLFATGEASPPPP
jgi:hypothetical protein